MQIHAQGINYGGDLAKSSLVRAQDNNKYPHAGQFTIPHGDVFQLFALVGVAGFRKAMPWNRFVLNVVCTKSVVEDTYII